MKKTILSSICLLCDTGTFKMEYFANYCWFRGSRHIVFDCPLFSTNAIIVFDNLHTGKVQPGKLFLVEL